MLCTNRFSQSDDFDQRGPAIDIADAIRRAATFGLTLVVEGIQIRIFEVKIGVDDTFATFATFFGPICQ